ncbi:MAG: GAF domain-containing sensor histidine kinase [Chloroflexota bacterium]|nr:GAF domain-containing sensor histidine kinase [Chloroflexota bacterium]
MSIGTVAAPPSALTEQQREARSPVERRGIGEAEIAALRPLLLRFVQHIAASFAECRCSVQLFETADTLRTVVVSDMPLGMIGQASFPLGVGIAGTVGQTGMPLLIHDVTKEPRYLSLRRESSGTIMCVPITTDTAFYGTLTAWAPKVGVFHRGTVATLRASAQGAALAVAQARRAMEQEATAHRATMLLALTRAVTACEDPRQALDIVLPFVCDVVPYTVGVLVTDGEEEAPAAAVFTRTLQTVGQRERLRQWALDAYAHAGARSAHGPRVMPLADIVAGHMVFAVPLRAAGTLVGLVCYFHTEPFDPEMQQVLQDCSSVIGTAAYNAQRMIHDAAAMRRTERTRAEFMGLVSHELRNPLTAIYGFLNILAQERVGPLTAMQRDFLDSASLSVRRLWRLVDDINDLVQADLGRLTLQREPVAMGDLIRAAIASVAPLCANARITVESAIPPSLPRTMADPVRLHQILNNLLSNAMKFSEPGTTIHVAVAVAEDMIRVSVRDTGPGIAAEDAERIFERFVKGTNIPQQDASGLGLGLAVVRQLVAAHGGRVWVESSGQSAAGSGQPIGGSMFVFTIPVVGSSQ